MPIYSIPNWSVDFENNRSRALKDLSFVLVPNSHDGDGFTQLMAHKKCCEVFTAWILIVQIASKCENRGVLMRSNGQPHTPGSLSRMTKAPESIFELAIPFLLSEELGWLESQPTDTELLALDGMRVPDADVPVTVKTQEGDEERKKRKKLEKEEKVQADMDADTSLLSFDMFWKVYPRREGKKKALESFLKAIAAKVDPTIIQRKAKEYSSVCNKDQVDRTLIKLPATWLNGEHWEDEYKLGVSSTRPSSKWTEQERQRRFEKAIDELERLEILEGGSTVMISNQIKSVFGEEKLKEAKEIVEFRKNRKDGAA